ncbi:hypothetical protein VTL71DRAFT_2976 [Oculimacula yallundae]|uniref:Uncharacterized protein n=1 Tax=Oculimacula yallundae TaxID=86028 RepID=A0ABR4C6P5_9HELO
MKDTREGAIETSSAINDAVLSCMYWKKACSLFLASNLRIGRHYRFMLRFVIVFSQLIHNTKKGTRSQRSWIITPALQFTLDERKRQAEERNLDMSIRARESNAYITLRPHSKNEFIFDISSSCASDIRSGRAAYFTSSWTATLGSEKVREPRIGTAPERK